MDSEDPPVEPADPFANATAQSKSRIADQMARQRKQLRRTPGKTGPNKALSAKPAKQKSTIAEAKKARTNTNILRHFDRQVDEKIAQIPLLSLTQQNISRVRWLVSIQAVIIAVLIATFIYGIFKLNDKNVYAARSHKAGEEDRVLRLTAMDGPTHTQAAVLSWASSTAASIMNFGFHNANERLGKMRGEFTSRGWKAFLDAIQESNLLDNIVTKEQVITAAPIGAPVIVSNRDLPDHNHEWIIQIPFMVTTLSGKQSNTQPRVMTMTIITVPPTDNLVGLGIDNWIES